MIEKLKYTLGSRELTDKINEIIEAVNLMSAMFGESQERVEIYTVTAMRTCQNCGTYMPTYPCPNCGQTTAKGGCTIDE